MSVERPEREKGLCWCGCGEPTPISNRTRRDRELVRGEPVRYLRGHHRRVFPVATEGVKWCHRCAQLKHLSEFHRCSTGSQGVQGRCKECNTVIMREYREKNPNVARDHVRLARWKRQTGSTRQDYERLFVEQEGGCAICGRATSQRRNNDGTLRPLAFDHCHSTGKIRGLLCTNCNAAIGLLNDDPALLEAAIAYLKRHDR